MIIFKIMKYGDLFSISFHQGEVDLPYNLKIQVNKIDNDSTKKYAYRFVALKKDNQGNSNIMFITSFFTALRYLQQSDANLSGLDLKYILPAQNQEEIELERIVYVDQPIFDSLFVTGYIGGEIGVVISSLSCPPQREA